MCDDILFESMQGTSKIACWALGDHKSCKSSWTPTFSICMLTLYLAFQRMGGIKDTCASRYISILDVACGQ
jgi:hypothetical protein